MEKKDIQNLVYNFKKYDLPMSVLLLNECNRTKNNYSPISFSFDKTKLPNPRGLSEFLHKNKIYLGSNIKTEGLISVEEESYLEFQKYYNKDLNKNILYVCLNEDNEYLISNSCLVSDVNFNCELRPKKCTAKFRYRQKDNDVTIDYLDNGEIIVRYNNVKSVTPGQACVLYDGDKCIGGGIIKEVRKDDKKLWYLL